MGILRKISSFAATALVAVAPLCIGFCAAPFAAASPSDISTTSTSTTNPAGHTENLTEWAQKNCPGGKQFDNNTYTNTPIYLGYADEKTYLGYTNTTWETDASRTEPKNQFIDARTLKTVKIINGKQQEVPTYKKKIGTCVRVAPDKTGQATEEVFYGTLFKADESALAASGFSENTKTVFQVTDVKPYEEGTKVESRAGKSSDNYQEMPHSVANNSSDSGFNNLRIGTENWIDLRFTQPGFYRVTLRATTTDPAKPAKIYQSEMPYMFIVGKEAPIPEGLKDDLNDNSGDNPNPPTPNPGETTPDTPTPGHSDNGGNTHPGTNLTPNPAVTPNPRTPNHGDTGGTSSHPGATSAPRPGAAPLLPQQPAGILPNLSKLGSLDNLGADNPPATNPDLDSPSQQGAGDSQGNNGALKFQAATGSTDQATKQWIRSSSLAVFGGGIAIAGLTGIGLLVFSRLNP